MLCYNQGELARKTLNKFPQNRNYDVLVINDGSTDRTSEYIQEFDFKVIHHSRNQGVGASIKTGVKYALENKYQVMAVIAGNNKDDPKEIPLLLKPILEKNFDYVQGSRFKKGGRWDNLPVFRYMGVKIHALLLTLLTGKRCTDALNGFRAFRLDVFEDPRIHIWQDWLNRYELEMYLHLKLLRLGYRFKEVSVSKIYPIDLKNVKYTHIKPVWDWWRILRPLILIGLGLRR